MGFPVHRDSMCFQNFSQQLIEFVMERQHGPKILPGLQNSSGMKKRKWNHAGGTRGVGAVETPSRHNQSDQKHIGGMCYFFSSVFGLKLLHKIKTRRRRANAMAVLSSDSTFNLIIKHKRLPTFSSSWPTYSNLKKKKEMLTTHIQPCNSM